MIAERIAAHLRRHRVSDDFPPVAFEDGLFFLEDTDKGSYLGACFIGTPLAGIDDTALEKLKSAASANFPPDTFIQLQWLAVPDIGFDVVRYLDPKLEAIRTSRVIEPHQRDLLREVTQRRADYLLDGKDTPHIPATGMRNRRVIQIISIKFPTQPHPSDKDIEEATEAAAKFEQGLLTTGFPVRRAGAGDYQGILRLIFDPWTEEDDDYDEDREIRDQLLPPGYRADYANSRQLDLNGTALRLLSVARYPKMGFISLMNMLVGDPGGLNNQFPVPMLLTLTIRYPDRVKKKRWFQMRHTLLTMQSQGSVARFVPRLRLKKEAYDELAQTLEGGDRLVDMCFSIVLMSKDERELAKLSAQMVTFAGGFGLELSEDSEILWPLFWNTLPLFPSAASIENTFRFSTMPLMAALQFAPVLGDWTGSADAVVMLETRRGELFGYDLYNTDRNYNALLFAGSGGGKSTMLNQLICDYLSAGARIRVADIGRSYLKTAVAAGGEFWEFSEESDICLNPFTYVIDIDDEMDMLKALLSKMAAPHEGLEEYGMARLGEAIKAVWGRMGNRMTISEVAEYMDRQKDERMQDVAKMLFAFTRHGQYGHWFDGDANVNFNSNFCVLELEELAAKEHLMQVVMMILMSKIQHEMFVARESGERVKQLAIFDEAWAHFKDPGVARFLNHAFRRFRKYSGSAIVCFQDVSDIYANEELAAVANNAATKFILAQEPEAIDAAVASGRLALDGYGAAQLKTVHTRRGQYSEMMIHTSGGWSICRLTMPRFHQVLFSTTGPERDLVIEAIEAGYTAKEAVEAYIRERG